MELQTSEPDRGPPRGVRWWPLAILLTIAVAVILGIRLQTDWPFQRRNLGTAIVALNAFVLVLLWWLVLSRTRVRLRLGVLGVFVAGLCLGAALFRITGVSGDLVPILEWRFARRATPGVAAIPASPAAPVSTTPPAASTNDFPQFYGASGNGVLPGPRLETNWTAHPPVMLWRQPVGAAWSGFVVVVDTCLTQEQRGTNECVVARELLTGRELWAHVDPAHYNTTIAGEGPRATPTIRSNRVYAAGATGRLTCLDLPNGRVIWQRHLTNELGGHMPEWGFAASPLLVNDLVVVHASEGSGHLLCAFRAVDGRPAWTNGTANLSYTSPSFAVLAGAPQILAFTRRTVSGHDPTTGTVLWEGPWTSQQVVCSTPIVTDTNRVMFSSGYGVGAELLEISRAVDGKFAAQRVWKSTRMKSKFGHLFVRDGCVFGLDDGIFACVDLKDGSQRWKEGHYGHGQGLLVGELYLLMVESGELVLLRPTRDAPNELARFPVFDAKTWNPIALAGDLLLVRNDREAACLRLTTAK